MKLLFKSKDGGPESNVTGYWLIESKCFFDIAILVFSKGSREAMHSHAFNSIAWCLKGHCEEELITGEMIDFKPSFKPIYIPRERMHRVWGRADKTVFLTFRGPWMENWKEFFPKINKFITLTKGRKVVNENS